MKIHFFHHSANFRFVGLIVTLLTFLSVNEARSQIYVPVYDGDYVNEYDSSTGSYVKTFSFNPTSGFYGSYTIGASNNAIFLANFQNNTVGSYNPVTGAPINASLINGFGSSGVAQFATSGDTLFIESQGVLRSFDSSTGLVINSSLPAGDRFAVSGNNLFVINGQTIGEYSATSGGTLKASLVTGVASGAELAISGDDLFVGAGTTIAEYNTNTGLLINPSFVSGLPEVGEMVVTGNSLFVYQGNSIGVYDSTSGATINGDLFNPNAPTSGVPPYGSADLLGSFAVLSQAAPEPSTYTMVLVGGLLLASARRFALVKSNKRHERLTM